MQSSSRLERAPVALAATPLVSGKALPPDGGDRPPATAAARTEPPPDLSRLTETLDRYLADSQRSLQFLRDPDAGRTIILVIDPLSGEVLRQIPPRERLALAQGFAAPRPPVIDLRA